MSASPAPPSLSQPRRQRRDVKLSKQLSKLLRHNAARRKIKLDAAGFASWNDVSKLTEFTVSRQPPSLYTPSRRATR